MPQTDHPRTPVAPMTPFEKALTWHALGKGFAPKAESVKHVDAILAELARLKGELASTPHPDPDLIARIRRAIDSAKERRFIAVPIDIEDARQLLAALDQPSPSPERSAEP